MAVENLYDPSLYDASTLDHPARLAALAHSGLLRHGPDDRLDLLCETACVVLSCTRAQVNMLEGLYQTSIGRWPPTDPRIRLVTDSACRAVIMSGQPVVVPDMRLHPLMCQIVGASSYLGVPIRFEGQVIGTFCVLDSEVREWTAWNIAGLQGLGRLAGLAVNV